MFPRDLIQLIGEYCVEYELTEKFFFHGSLFKCGFSFEASRFELNDIVTVHSYQKKLTTVTKFVDAGEKNVPVMSDCNVIIGRKIVIERNRYQVVSKFANILSLDSPVVESISRGSEVHGVFYISNKSVISKIGMYHIDCGACDEGSIVRVKYTNKHPNRKTILISY